MLGRFRQCKASIILKTKVVRDPIFFMIFNALLPVYKLERGFVVSKPNKDT